MKLLIIASFVALCCASTLYRGKNISVGEDGTITITNGEGKRIVLTRPIGLNGQKNLDISVSGPNFPSKLIQINDDTLYDSEIRGAGYPWSSVDSVNEEYRLKRGSKKGQSQGDVLAEILREYQGSVDEVSYEKLMARLEKAVKKGLINPQVFAILNGLEQSDFDTLISQQGLGQILGQQVYGQQGQVFVPQVVGQSGIVEGVNPWVRRYIGQSGIWGNRGIWGQNGVQGQIGQGFVGQYKPSTLYTNPLLQGIQGNNFWNQQQQIQQQLNEQQVQQEIQQQLIGQQLQGQWNDVVSPIINQQVQQLQQQQLQNQLNGVVSPIINQQVQQLQQQQLQNQLNGVVSPIISQQVQQQLQEQQLQNQLNGVVSPIVQTGLGINGINQPQWQQQQLLQQEVQQVLQQQQLQQEVQQVLQQQQLQQDVYQQLQQQGVQQQQLQQVLQGLGQTQGLGQLNVQQGLGQLAGGVYGLGYNKVALGNPSGIVGQTLLKEYLFGRQYPFGGQKQIVGGLRQVLGLNGVLSTFGQQQQQPIVLQNERVILDNVNTIPQVVY